MKQITITFVLVFLLATFSSTAQTSKVLIDNEKVKVTEFISQPGEDVCGKGKHTHSDHVTILLTDAIVTTTTAEGATQSETYLENKHLYTVTENGKTQNIPTDGTFWVKGVTHSVINTGSKPMRFYIIETK